MASPPFHQPSVPALWWAEPEREEGTELGNLGSLLQVHPSERPQMFLHVFPTGWWSRNSFPIWPHEDWGVSSPSMRPRLGSTCPTLTNPAVPAWHLGDWVDLGWGMGIGEVSEEMRSVLLVEGVWRSGAHRGEDDGRVNTSPVRGPTGSPRGRQQVLHQELLQGEKASFLLSSLSFQ